MTKVLDLWNKVFYILLLQKDINNGDILIYGNKTQKQTG